MTMLQCLHWKPCYRQFLAVQRLGLTHEDIKIRVNNRKVLQTVAQQCNIPDESFSAVCVILDKLEKIPEDQVRLQDTSVATATSLFLKPCQWSSRLSEQ